MLILHVTDVGGKLLEGRVRVGPELGAGALLHDEAVQHDEDPVHPVEVGEVVSDQDPGLVSQQPARS